ncbi:helix-turn-helix transcriptional regulator [Novosphingobium resinovorum]|uniref:helix-turn-helix transcriptional regulator n=1 Tax=Novosphingobium resinovorum TaxID=158500 RepID=UPI002ED547A8|nr:LuxR C-terminal-related transcriptional regulator [Novosphingobium resinovorum]
MPDQPSFLPQCGASHAEAGPASGRLAAFVSEMGSFRLSVMDNRTGHHSSGMTAPKRLNWETHKAGALSLIAQALIVEDDVFWANPSGIVTMRPNEVLARLWKRTVLELSVPAFMAIAVRASLGRIGGVILTPRSSFRTDLSAEYAAFGKQFASLARDFMLEHFDGSPEIRDTALPGVLSPREVQCIRLIAMGRTDDEIADSMTIARTTVRYHFTNLCEKLGASSRANAVYRAATLGLLPSAA